MMQKLKITGVMFLAIFGFIFGLFGSFKVIGLFMKTFLLPDRWLFFEYSPLAGFALIWLIVIPLFLVCWMAMDYFKSKIIGDVEEVQVIKQSLSEGGIGRIILPLAWVFAIYLCCSSFTVVTPEKIIRHTPINPSGREYAYTDVEKVETGFGTKSFALYDYKKEGNFYYIITVNGKEIVFSQPTVNENEERFEDSYFELEEFDIALMENGIKKESSREGFEDCGYEKWYVDRFLRIIDRK